MGEMWFGHYRLERLLGSGGTGRVWLARDTRTDQNVALKVLAAELAADPTYRQRFTREARLAALLRGPHTVPIHSFGELDGRLYLDMEFIEGIDGAVLLRREGRLAPEPAVRIVSQAATALDAAHRIGLVHRDVKPSNLMVTPTGSVCLIDFGIATRTGQPPITATGQMVGTLGYLAPERFAGAADARSDQYSLACVLYELLTRRRPFGDGDSPEQMCAHLLATPPAASDLVAAVPAELDAVIARGMAKDPGQRWSSAGEFAAAAYAAATGKDMPTVEISPVATPTAVIATAVAPAAYSGTVHATAPLHATSTNWIAADAARTPVAHSVAGQSAPAPGSAAPPLSTRPTTRPRTYGPLRERPRFAVAALAVLAAVIGGALWLGRPGAAETDSAVPTTRPGTPTAVPSLPTAAPIAAPAIVSTPVVGQPCDPAVYGTGFDGDGVSLHCTGSGDSASWTRVPPQPITVEPNMDAPGVDDNSGPSQGNSSGQGSSSGQGNSGNSGNGNGSNGNGSSNGNGIGSSNGNGNSNGNGIGIAKPPKPYK